MTEAVGREILIEGVDPRELYGAQDAYLEQIRLEHARAFLTQGLSVGDTAQKCGFSSIEYFSNTFRKAVGCSPSQYKSGRADSPK